MSCTIIFRFREIPCVVFLFFYTSVAVHSRYVCRLNSTLLTLVFFTSPRPDRSTRAACTLVSGEDKRGPKSRDLRRGAG